MFIGVDIGGTKTSVSVGNDSGTIIEKSVFGTDPSLQHALQNICESIEHLVLKYGKEFIRGIGIACGGPLDARNGIVLSPPNLPSWSNVRIVDILQKRFDIPTFIENDANACVLAEWYYGNGKGCNNLIFLTFGTGLGAGMILNGELYQGAIGLSGEIGHVRIAEDGPDSYGKRGSLEGYCSGGGISLLYRQHFGETLTTEQICKLARRGEGAALKIVKDSAAMLGRGVSILIDLINPEKIIIGSVYTKNEDLFREEMMAVVTRESLRQSAACCEIVISGLADSLGDVAAVSVAVNKSR